MDKFNIVFSSAAASELEEIAMKHLNLVGPKSAKRITDKLFASLERLKSFPNSGAPTPDSRLNMDGYKMVVCENYVSIYRVIADDVYVYHIADARTDYPKLFRK